MSTCANAKSRRLLRQQQRTPLSVAPACTNLIHQAKARRFGSADHSIRQVQRYGRSTPEPPDQSLREFKQRAYASRQVAMLKGGGRCADQVASSETDRDAPAWNVAMSGCNHRHSEATQGAAALRHRQQTLGKEREGRSRLVPLMRVGTNAEVRAGSLQHDGARLFALAQVRDCIAQVARQLDAERIEVGGIAQIHQPDIAGCNAEPDTRAVSGGSWQ
jgi:hypothetical protein